MWGAQPWPQRQTTASQQRGKRARVGTGGGGPHAREGLHCRVPTFQAPGPVEP